MENPAYYRVSHKLPRELEDLNAQYRDPTAEAVVKRIAKKLISDFSRLVNLPRLS